jgi:hypothetical protein
MSQNLTHRCREFDRNELNPGQQYPKQQNTNDKKAPVSQGG